MARLKVIVKRLAAIENFGTMNVLCSDKTGTLTEGIVHVNSALDPEGKESERTLLYAYINASFETGFTNPIDDAIEYIESSIYPLTRRRTKCPMTSFAND